MSLKAGTPLGSYEILALIGTGGMGEVYKAKDTRLDRTVAIKVLPTHLADNPDLKQRFEREARAVSSLNHPHICTLHDIGEQDGTEFLVMEYIEGETLADRLRKGGLPLEQALRYAIEIADALDKAHRQGVVHRDLKPGNIMLTKSGAKLLDFGLAKLRQDVSAETPSLLSALPTEEKPLTREGSIMGTFQYMAPEQLEGKDTDARTDIFAFGSVLYEMLTGRKAFEGTSQASLIAAIMEHEPVALSQLQTIVPPDLERLVHQCLEKDPEDRWYSAHDLRTELKWIAEGGAQADAMPTTKQARWNYERLAWAGATLLLLLALAAGYFNRAPEPDAAVQRFSIPPPQGSYFRGEAGVLSPDGRFLAFVAADDEGYSQLWVRPLDTLVARPLPGTDEASSPFWSPNSRTIGFIAERQLKTIDLDSEQPRTLSAAPGLVIGASWNKEGTILFGTYASGIRRVSASGGEAVPLTEPDSAYPGHFHGWPYFLPDGNHFLYWARRTDGSGIYVGSLRSAKSKLLLEGVAQAKYAPPGYILFQQRGTLMVQPFDTAALELIGDPIPLVSDVWHGLWFGAGAYSVSGNGVLAYQTGGISKAELRWLDREGRGLGSVGEPEPYPQLALSPDERRVAVERVDPDLMTTDLWVLDLARGGVASRLTFDPLSDRDPVWSPDGTRIAFNSARRGTMDIYEKSLVEEEDAKLLLESPQRLVTEDWSSDGRFIAYQFGSPSQGEIWLLSLCDERESFPFLQTPFNLDEPRFSPDGKWMAYVSDETGQFEVYVQSIETRGVKLRVSTEGGGQPRWRGDGKELFYLASDGSMMAVAMKEGQRLEPGHPARLFHTGISAGPDIDQYAVTADGQRFLILKPSRATDAAPVTIVLNWTAELKN
jgi:Tol biopolymer transport system component/predicted Ser/Thr protein kinase